MSVGASGVLTPTTTSTQHAARIPLVLWLLSALPLLLLVVPLLALIVRTLPSGQWVQALRDPIVTQALGLSLVTTAITFVLSVVVGTPIAYLLARYRFRGREVLDTLIDLPMVLPPTVAGVALLMTFGRRGLFGPLLGQAGIEIAFTVTAVVLAQTFVAAPFYIRAARVGFEAVDPQLEQVAATLGESNRMIFWRVTVPLAFPSLLGGAVMTWARALGEFGATIMFAGNLPGRTQTMPLAVYVALESNLFAALTLSLILLVVSFGVLFAVRLIAKRGRGRLDGA